MISPVNWFTQGVILTSLIGANDLSGEHADSAR